MFICTFKIMFKQIFIKKNYVHCKKYCWFNLKKISNLVAFKF